MAAKKENENAVVETTVKDEASSDAYYTVSEYCKAGVVDGRAYSKDLIKAAFLDAGIEIATQKQASAIVQRFAEKEVEH